jgi:tetratricopeptide (TPR) repeat protein
MNALVLLIVLQASLLLPPRTAMENPASASRVPQGLQKDYSKLWARFQAGKEDAKLLKDLDKLLQKQKTFEPAWIIEGYIALHQGDDVLARNKFIQAVSANPKNRIALYYLAELAYAHAEWGRAATLYAELISIDAGRPELETKRQKAFLLATDSLLRGALRAEAENRLAEAEDYYRQALKLAPKEPALHARLVDVLLKDNKKEEAEAERKIIDELTPRRAATAPAVPELKADALEDLGRWGSDIAEFHKIRDSETITREQFAVLIARYFPQVFEFRQAPQIITDIDDSPARGEIQTIVGISLMQPFPNHNFEPSVPLTRGELARGLARLSRLLAVSAPSISSNDLQDVASTNTMYTDVQLVLGSGMMTLEGSGAFNVTGQVSGRQAVQSVDRLLRIFQQVQR